MYFELATKSYALSKFKSATLSLCRTLHCEQKCFKKGHVLYAIQSAMSAYKDYVTGQYDLVDIFFNE